MNIPAQLLPHKHIRFCESLIGLAGCIRQLLDKPRTVDDLYSILNSSSSVWLYKPSFEQVVTAVVILFAIGQIAETDNNQLQIIEKPLNKVNSLEAQQANHKKDQFISAQSELSEGFGQS
jgi:hypothetical protein